MLHIILIEVTKGQILGTLPENQRKPMELPMKFFTADRISNLSITR